MKNDYKVTFMVLVKADNVDNALSMSRACVHSASESECEVELL